MAQDGKGSSSKRKKKQPIRLGAANQADEPRHFEVDRNAVMAAFMGDIPSPHVPGSVLPPGALRGLAHVPLLGAPIQIRLNQIAEHCQAPPDMYSPGCEVVLRDAKQEASKASQKKAKEILEIILDAGGKYGFGSLEASVRALMRDSLTYDLATAEILSKGSDVVGWVPIDASTIRRARPSDEALEQGRLDRDDIGFVQVFENRIVAEWEPPELMWGIRRPRTTLAYNGYGFPELDELITTITDLLNAETYNSVAFTNGIHTNTVLALMSEMDEPQFNAFKSQMQAMMSGPRNARRTPIVQLDPVNKEELKAVNLGMSNKDMEFQQWMGFLIKVIFAVMGMDPAEAGFVFGTENQSASLGGGSPRERIVASKERGLRPLLRALETWINRWIVWPIDRDFMFRFVGLDRMSREEHQKLDAEAVKSYKTINEVRAEHDLEPLDSPIGDMILDPSYINSEIQMKQMEQMGGEGGEEGEGQEEDGAGPGEPGAADDGEQEGGGFDLDTMTQQIAGGMEKALRSGEVGGRERLRKGGRYAFVDSTPSRRAYIAEVVT